MKQYFDLQNALAKAAIVFLLGFPHTPLPLPHAWQLVSGAGPLPRPATPGYRIVLSHEQTAPVAPEATVPKNV